MAAAVRPLPAITPELKPFFEGAKQGRLLVQKCAQCGKFRFPPQQLCDNCWSWKSSFEPVSGRGEILSFVVMHQVYHPGFAPLVPYTVARVKLAEGAVLTSNVIGIAPRELRCGMPVEVVFEKVSDEVTLPMFRPARA